MRGTSQAAAAERDGRHSKITTVFLDENVRRCLGSAKERMFRVIDAHRFGNTRLVFMTGLDLPAFLQFPQRQTIWCVAVNFIRRSKNEWRFRAKISRCFKQIERAVGVDGKV